VNYRYRSEDSVCPVCKKVLEEECLCPVLEVCHACLHQHDGLPKLIRSIESQCQPYDIC
jgi:hypothetical protein